MSGIAAGIARYIVWLALCGISLWTTLQVRLNVLDVIFWMRTSRWAIPALDKFLTVPLILLWLGVAIWLESYLTEPRDVRVFGRRAVRVSVVTVVVLALSYLLQALM